MRSDSSARELETSADDSFEELHTARSAEVSPIGRARVQTVEEVVRAYFDALVMQSVPDELNALVRRLG